ncbi:hypothetical protein [Paraburkholderia azotifigens]|uniref:Uncharacterized protein n=1 Tax=Paraburkholderia azotifigens TaxID=2057004 RepID=A0A5C6VP52_9BURK|nr:hypothetical protein [Paraburkholderia azotifigens]TXC85525.1 hypothetical protein FRZ40_17015 [Paraburkholderia azotifigens]
MSRSTRPMAELLDEMAAALQALEGLELAVGFVNDDPASIEAAIHAIEMAIAAELASRTLH